MKYGYLENVDDVSFELPPEHLITTSLLTGKQAVKHPKIYIGGPVFSDKSFVGKVYPPKTRVKDFLSAYSQQFNCIEVNSTRFGVPALKTQLSWIDKVEEGFKFSFKMPQVITHRKDMNDRGGVERTDQFLECLDRFGSKAGMTYMLLPNYFKMERWPMIKEYLSSYPTDLPLAIEARNNDFHQNTSVHEFLQSRNISLCVTDTPGRRDVMHQVLLTDELIVRFGGGNLHSSDYTRIDQWVSRIIDWLDRGLKTLYFYVHQPSPTKHNMGIIVAYMIEQLRLRKPDLRLKKPIDYSISKLVLLTGI